MADNDNAQGRQMKRLVLFSLATLLLSVCTANAAEIETLFPHSLPYGIKVMSPSLIARKTVFSPVSTITFSGLHGATDGGYRLIAVVPDMSAELNEANPGACVVAFINNDMDMTHYSSNSGWGGSTVSFIYYGSLSPQPQLPVGTEVLFYNVNDQVSWNYYPTDLPMLGPSGIWFGSGSISSIKFKVYTAAPDGSTRVFVNFPKGTIFSLFRLFD